MFNKGFSFELKISRLMQNYNYLRKFCIIAIPCEWSEWVGRACSATCGTGTRTKTRSKLVEEKDGGTCSDEPTKNEPCQDKDCPGNEFGNICSGKLLLYSMSIVQT